MEPRTATRTLASVSADLRTKVQTAASATPAMLRTQSQENANQYANVLMKADTRTAVAMESASREV